MTDNKKIQYKANINGTPVYIEQEASHRHHSSPIQVSTDNSVPHEKAIVARFQAQHALQGMYGAHGHLIGHAASPYDLHHALTTNDKAKEMEVELTQGEDLIQPDKPHHHDGQIPDNAVH